MMGLGIPPQFMVQSFSKRVLCLSAFPPRPQNNCKIFHRRSDSAVVIFIPAAEQRGCKACRCSVGVRPSSLPHAKCDQNSNTVLSHCVT